jgi:hypothetical protein
MPFPELAMPHTSQHKKRFGPFAIPADVEIQHSRQVNAYLRQHSDLAKLVPPICQSTREAFGIKAELCLDLYKDPEISDRHLVLLVRLPSYDNRTMDRIYEITEAFDAKLSNASGWFQVTTDFRMVKANHEI